MDYFIFYFLTHALAPRLRKSEKSKRRKVNPPIVAAHEEDDEKQQEEEEDQNNPSVLEEADAQFEIDNEHVENPEQDEGDLSDLEDIFEPKRQEDNKEDQDVCILITWRKF